jgi:molybdenum cofactor biosynthesis enzyme MoaA
MLHTDKTIVAVRSLTHQDHATNIPPTVLSVNWNIGKRCNYDCSYCNHMTHDAVSPFINRTDALSAIDQLYSQVLAEGKTVDWSFTGGEPFLDPSFMDILAKISSYQIDKCISVSSNGSLPLHVYIAASQYISNLTITIHPERSSAELDRTISTIKELNKIPDLMLSVTIMVLTGGTTLAKTVLNHLIDNKVNAVLRKIRPPTDLHPYEHMGADKKDRVLPGINRQVNIRIHSRLLHDKKSAADENSYYQPDELAFLQSYYDKESPWNNMGVWYDDGSYSEVNTDELLTANKHSFTNWICFAGVDAVYIDFDGSVYRGNCYMNGPIGHIKDAIAFTKHPTRCKLNWCTCNADMTVRKVSKTIYLKLVT